MFLKSENLEKCSEIIHGFTTRELGSDYVRIGKEIGVSAESIKTLNQIHSDKVVLIPPPLEKGGRGDFSNATSFGSEGDALITQTPGIVVGVRTADCVPLLAYDPEHKAVAAIHAGWKGVLVGIIESSIKAMQKEFKTKPSALIIAVGATLCPPCFEMGPEVARDFQKKFGKRLPITKGRDDRSHLDLRHACEIILNDLGVHSDQIEYLPYCNKCREDLFFSFRRGDKNPRQLSFIGLI